MMLPQLFPFAALSGGGSSFAAGTIGVWFMDDYQATPMPHVPNSASNLAIRQNLFPVARRMFSNGSFWNGDNCAITDLAEAAQDGTVSATRVTSGGDFWIDQPVATRRDLPNSVYTLGITAMRGAGSDQNFKQSFFGAGFTSPTRVATDAWQRFSFTSPSPISGVQYIIPIISQGFGGGDILIDNAGLYAGATDLGDPALAGHLYLGNGDETTVPPYSSGALDFSDGPWGLIQFPELSLSTFSFLVLARFEGAESSNFNGFLSKVQNYASFSLLGKTDNEIEMWLTGFRRTDFTWTKPMLVADGWHVIGFVETGTSMQIWLDSVLIAESLATPSSLPVALQDLYVGRVTNEKGDHSIAAMQLVNRALLPSEMRAAVAQLSARGATGGNVVTEHDAILVAEGDSITAGTEVNADQAYANLYALETEGIYFSNFAVNASTLANAVDGRQNRIDAALRPGKTCVLSVLYGRNDLIGTSTAQFLTNLFAYCDARRAAGWIVVLCTILPSTVAATTDQFEAKRQDANTEIRASQGVHCDYVCDFGGDLVMGPEAAASDPLLYPDETHPSIDGHVNLKVLAKPVYDLALGL